MRVDCCKLDYFNWTLNLSVEFLEKKHQGFLMRSNVTN